MFVVLNTVLRYAHLAYICYKRKNLLLTFQPQQWVHMHYKKTLICRGGYANPWNGF